MPLEPCQGYAQRIVKRLDIQDLHPISVMTLPDRCGTVAPSVRDKDRQI